MPRRLQHTWADPAKLSQIIDGPGDAGLGEEIGDLSLDVLPNVGIGALCEALESTLPEAIAEGAAGTGGDLAFAPLGLVLEVAISETIQHVKVNRPAARMMGDIRRAVNLKSDIEVVQELRGQLKKAKPEILQRLLAKVHAHYLDRIHTRLKKLETRVRPFGNSNTRDGMTCTDAANIVRPS